MQWFLPYIDMNQPWVYMYKKDLHTPDNHDGVIIHLESDILECEVKWALGSITMNKASASYFRSWKMML